MGEWPCLEHREIVNDVKALIEEVRRDREVREKRDFVLIQEVSELKGECRVWNERHLDHNKAVKEDLAEVKTSVGKHLNDRAAWRESITSQVTADSMSKLWKRVLVIATVTSAIVTGVVVGVQKGRADAAEVKAKVGNSERLEDAKHETQNE